MSSQRKNKIYFSFLLLLSIGSFIYLNFYGFSAAETISETDIATYQAVESSSFPEVKAVTAFFSRLIEIVNL